MCCKKWIVLCSGLGSDDDEDGAFFPLKWLTSRCYYAWTHISLNVQAYICERKVTDSVAAQNVVICVVIVFGSKLSEVS